jgi:hypothetical protein
MIKKSIILGFLLLQFNFLVAQKIIQTDVLIVGGGVGGTASAIQAARLGVKVVLLESTIWLGGMLSAAGVSATDGNHKLPSGLWNEFREQIYKVYGGPKAVETGWVSNTHFEPRVADSILKAIVTKEKNVKVYYNSKLDKINHSAKQVTIKNIDSAIFNVKYKIIIDATELGDVMAMLKVPYSIGMEGNEITGENIEGITTNAIIQDLTYTAIVKDYGMGADKTIVKPFNYSAAEFDGVCKEWCSDTTKRKTLVGAQQMLDYAKLPNNKYLLNWPNKGNDTYLNIIDKNETARAQALVAAKETTLRFLYFIQTQLGYKNLGLAIDEFPTQDFLPLMAYHREGRRLKGLVRLTANHIKAPYNYNLYKTGISVGDYPIDHHHKKNIEAPQQLEFYPIPSYNIPLGTLIPKHTDGFIIAEKAISVTNVVNGTTRLQPVVMLTGQAAGTLAALSVLQKKQPRFVSVRSVQNMLIKAKAYIMPYIDVPPTHTHWESIQRVGATGLLKGKGIPYKWANQTWFYPDSLAVKYKNYLADIGVSYDGPEEFIKIGLEWDAVFMLLTKEKKYKKSLTKEMWQSLGLNNFDLKRNFTRAEFAVVLDKVLHVFKKEVAIDGNYK